MKNKFHNIIEPEGYKKGSELVQDTNKHQVFLDVNSMMSLNDSRGHLVGDEYLTFVMQTIVTEFSFSTNNCNIENKYYRVIGNLFVVTHNIDFLNTEGILREINGILSRYCYARGFIDAPYKKFHDYYRLTGVWGLKQPFNILEEKLHNEKVKRRAS